MATRSERRGPDEVSPWVLTSVALMLSAPAEDHSRLRWSAPLECPTEAAVVDEIEGLTGIELSEAATISIDAAVHARAHGGYQLSLRIETDTGAQVRTLDADDCDALAGAAATLIAVAMETVVTEPSSTFEPQRAPQESPPPAPEPAPPPAPEPAQKPGPGQRWEGYAGMSVGLGLGALPGATALGSVTVGTRTRRVAMEADAALWLPRSTQLAVASGTVLLWAAGARACGLPAAGPVKFPACLGIQGGQVSGRAQGVDNARRAALPWVALTARAGVRVPLTDRLSLRTDLELLVPTLRPGFTIDGVGLLHRVEPVGGTAGLGLEFKFS